MAARDQFSLVARSTRNHATECWHYGACAVSRPDGRLVARIGDPEQPMFLRSAAKPFQAMPLLLAGGWNRAHLTRAELALICASHGGTPAHVRRAADLLLKGGFKPNDLLCGAHDPLDEACASRLRCAGRKPMDLHNNCSGKHAGMLLACRLLDLPSDDYIAADHPLQLRILKEIALFAGVEETSIGLATDGCSVPSYRLPMAAAARAYAALADPVAAGLDDERCKAVDRVFDSMTEVPEMVAGLGRFTTRLIEATKGRILGKEGAQGFYGIAVREPVVLGLTVKIADGGESCRDSVVLEILRQLDCIGDQELAQLRDFRRPAVKNCRSWVVGEIFPDFELEEETRSGVGG